MTTLADTASAAETRYAPKAWGAGTAFTALLTCHPDGTVTLSCRGVTGTGHSADAALRDLRLKLLEAEPARFDP